MVILSRFVALSVSLIQRASLFQAFDAYPFGNHIPVPGGNGKEAVCQDLRSSLEGTCSRNISLIAEAISGIVSYPPAAGKEIWLVAQVFGNRETFRRSPSAEEERAFVYLALIHG